MSESLEQPPLPDWDESDTHWAGNNPRPDELDPPPSVGAVAQEVGGELLEWPSPQDRQRQWRALALNRALQAYDRMGPVKRRHSTEEESRGDFINAQGDAIENLFKRLYRLLDVNGDGS